MIAIGAVARLALLVPVLYLVMVVYAGLKETDAAGTLRSAAFKTVRTMVWLVGIGVAMFAIEWLWID